LLLASRCFGATEVPKTVDPDNAGGTDYTSLDSYEDNLGGTTTGHLPNDDQIAIAECRSSSGTNDTAPVTIAGWTTDATRYIKITGAGTDGDFPADGIYDATKYVLHNNDSALYMLDIREDYVRLERLQILITETSTNTRRGITFINVGTSVYYIDSCIIKGACSGTGVGGGIYHTDADVTLYLYNTVFTGFRSGADTGFRALQIGNDTNTYVYNCTFYDNYYGVYQNNGTMTVINCAFFNNTDDMNTVGGSLTIDYCGTEQGVGEGTNGFTITQTADDYAALVVDAAGDDFHLTDASSELYNTGNGATPKGTFTDDIVGTARGPADLDWDVGAFELTVAVGAAGMQIISIIQE
jgi:hypothetical protein